jgi:hypothetical protein
MHQKRPREILQRMFASKLGPKHLRTSQRKYWNSVFTGEPWRQKASQ